MTKELVSQYYFDSVRKEWRRLVADPYHQLEFDTTFRFLEKYLPDQGHILDAGGGPGRYTIELAGRGYQLTLLDFTPVILEFARRCIKRAGVKKKVQQVVEGSKGSAPTTTRNLTSCIRMKSAGKYGRRRIT